MEGAPEAVSARITAWLSDQVRQSGAEGALVGLSGGLDSATVAMLLHRALPGRALGVVMPCHSDPADTTDGLLSAEAASLETLTVDLTAAYDGLVTQADPKGDAPGLALANVKPRLRMSVLYFEAARRHYLVAGTGNRTELELGYFTKHGDGGVDLLPLGGLLKTEVRDLARALGVPERILQKPPSAGLWAGQTDEAELGFSYEALDRYLAHGEGPEALRQTVEARRAQSAHKRRLPPVFQP